MKRAKINFHFRAHGRQRKWAKFVALARRGRERMRIAEYSGCINGRNHAWEEDGQTLMETRWHCPVCGQRQSR